MTKVDNNPGMKQGQTTGTDDFETEASLIRHSLLECGNKKPLNKPGVYRGRYIFLDSTNYSFKQLFIHLFLPVKINLSCNVNRFFCGNSAGFQILPGDS